MRSQIQKKKRRIVELLMPTLNKIIRTQDTYFVAIMNNRLKIIRYMVFPSKVREDFFQK